MSVFTWSDYMTLSVQMPNDYRLTFGLTKFLTSRILARINVRNTIFFRALIGEKIVRVIFQAISSCSPSSSELHPLVLPFPFHTDTHAHSETDEE